MILAIVRPVPFSIVLKRPKIYTIVLFLLYLHNKNNQSDEKFNSELIKY